LVGNGKSGWFDAGPAAHAFVQGPGPDDLRGDHLPIQLHDVLHEIAVGNVFREAQRECQAPDTPEPADEHLRAASGLVALDALEEQGRALLLEHASRDGAELPVPVHLGRDATQLAFLVEPPDPLPHVDEAHHSAPHAPSAGATSPRKRLNCPTWSHEPKRSAMWPTPASKYARSSSTHRLGPPEMVHCSTNWREKFEV